MTPPDLSTLTVAELILIARDEDHPQHLAARDMYEDRRSAAIWDAERAFEQTAAGYDADRFFWAGRRGYGESL